MAWATAKKAAIKAKDAEAEKGCVQRAIPEEPFSLLLQPPQADIARVFLGWLFPQASQRGKNSYKRESLQQQPPRHPRTY